MRNKRILILSLTIFLFIIYYPRESAAEEIIIEREQIDILPNGRCTGSILENWIPYAVFFQVETGGLSRMDSPRFSSHGISWIEQNYLVNNVNITDPFRSGYPLLEPAWETISEISVASAGENDPHNIGLNWEVDLPEYNQRYQASYNIILPVIDDSLIPEGKMDREPSFPYGSSKVQRKYNISNELNGAYNSYEKFFLGIEALNTSREFPTLKNENGDLIEEQAGKYTLTAIRVCNNVTIPYKLIFIGNYEHNDNYGSTLRLDKDETLNQSRQANHIQLNAGKKLNTGEIKVLSGLTTGYEDLKYNTDKPAVINFADESGPVPDAGNIFKLNFDNKLNYKYELIDFEAGFQATAVNYKPEIPYSQTMNSYDGNIYAVTVWDETEACRENVYNSKLKMEVAKEWDSLSLSGNIYADNATATANGGRLLNWFGIGGKISSGYLIKRSDTKFNISVLHQPAKINSNIVAFLNNNRPSGETFTGWTDQNGNGTADDYELSGATLVSTTGGKYHHTDENLKRPYHDELTIGINQGITENLDINIRGIHRIFSDYFIVNYKDYNGTYTDTPDGYTIYNKPVGTDEYYLSNYTEDRSYYSGIETEFLWETGKLYLKFMVTAFMVTGFAPIGNGADYNDYAVISEETASPNSRINSSGGRLDSDRAYMANILLGYKIRKDFSFGLTLKYRDGEPFSQYKIFYDSNGMPVKIMQNERGNWDGNGTGRYTFAWNMDIRLRYTPVVFDTNLLLTLDIYNVLGSSTEIIESYDPEDERQALEAVPQRMIKFGMEMRI